MHVDAVSVHWIDLRNLLSRDFNSSILVFSPHSISSSIQFWAKTFGPFRTVKMDQKCQLNCSWSRGFKSLRIGPFGPFSLFEMGQNCILEEIEYGLKVQIRRIEVMWSFSGSCICSTHAYALLDYLLFAPKSCPRVPEITKMTWNLELGIISKTPHRIISLK